MKFKIFKTEEEKRKALKKKYQDKAIVDLTRGTKQSKIAYIVTGAIVFFVVFRLSGIAAANDTNILDAFGKVGENGPMYLFFPDKAVNGPQQIVAGLGLALFAIMGLNVAMERNKPAAPDPYGSARWHEPAETIPYRSGDGKDPKGNTIFTQTEWMSRNMKTSERNRNIIMVGRPGTGKSRYFFKPNMLNADGTIVCTDPKGELLRDCGYSLKQKGYDIKVLNLVDKYKSNNYNPLMYIKKVPRESISPEDLKRIEDEGGDPNDVLAEDDVMSLINIIFKNTKGDVDQTSGDPFWEKAEMIYLQAIIYYVLFRCPKYERNFEKVLELMRLSAPKSEDDDTAPIDAMFAEWESVDPTNIGVKQWKHFKTAKGKTLSSILMTATARLAPLNINEVNRLISIDNMELDRIGRPTSEKALKAMGLPPNKGGRVAYFIITDPGNNTFNFIANIMYTQIFSIINVNAMNNRGSLATPCDLYMDEWAQLGEIPRFVEELAYVRGLNVGVVVGLQSLDQLKNRYKESWQTALDCCDYILFLGSSSKDTLEYITTTYMGKATVGKNSGSRTFGKSGSNTHSWDSVSRELATIDELGRIKKGECVLYIANLGAFHSTLYDITKHPDYGDLYEPWQDKVDEDGNFTNPEMHAKYYDHYQTIKDTRERMQVDDELAEAGVSIEYIPDSKTVTYAVI